MNTPGAQHNPDPGRSYADRDTSGITLDDLDPGAGQRFRQFGMRAALLRELHDSGGVAPWAELRRALNALGKARYWELVEALTRLHDQGSVHAAKIGGRTFVSLPIARP